MASRPASHASSWYSGDPAKLQADIERYLGNVPPPVAGIRPWSSSLPRAELPAKGARIVIAPHAGYRFSGQAAAWAYKALDLENVERIFVIGPSHTGAVRVAGTTRFATLATPLGELTVDTATSERITAEGGELFEQIEPEDDVDEHSLEMQLPYIKYLLSHRRSSSAGPEPRIVPVLIGGTDEELDEQVGRLLAPYVADPGSAFVISSDFCHWGRSYRFGHLWTKDGQWNAFSSRAQNKLDNETIVAGIAGLDHRCMDAIERGSHRGFVDVLYDTRNNVCGSHPIRVVMAAIELAKEADERLDENWGRFRFVRYERSQETMSAGESSVSYCSAYAIV